jgi:hypothetical protein
MSKFIGEASPPTAKESGEKRTEKREIRVQQAESREQRGGRSECCEKGGKLAWASNAQIARFIGEANPSMAFGMPEISPVQTIGK